MDAKNRESAKGMLFTWGYCQSTPADLAALVRRFEVDMVYDCRSVPKTRVKGFGPLQLAELLGARYRGRGETLGGRGAGPDPASVRALARLVRDGERILLMCVEHAPGDCHRHKTIALPLRRYGLLGPDQVLHLFEREMIEPLELQRAIDADDDYEYEEMDEAA